MTSVHNKVKSNGEIVQAAQADLAQLSNFIHQNHQIHRHLDWFGPLDWLGKQPYLYIYDNNQVEAVICAVPDNPEIAWIRTFGIRDTARLNFHWSWLLTETITKLRNSGIKKIASLSLHKWFEDLLLATNFENLHNIIVLQWQGIFPRKQPLQLELRPMTDGDLQEVEQIDQKAFPPIWQNSLEGIKKAIQHKGVRTVALDYDNIIGYQISTTMTIYGHLARLAVHPDFQNAGIGYAIVYDLLKRLEQQGLSRITVNTQSNNLPSLKLYKQLGFIRTGEEIPVYELEI